MSYSLPISTKSGVIPCQAPTLLARCFHQSLLLEIFRKNTGDLFGKVTDGERSRDVLLRGLPSTLPSSLLGRAITALQGCRFAWDGNAITLKLSLLGGGCTQSTSRREEPAQPVQMINSVDDTLPPGWGIPRRNQAFIGRTALLTEMRKKLTESGEAAISQVAIAGLGGVGKTGLVTEYLHRNRNNYSVAWWISGENPMSGYRDLGESLGIVQPADKGDVVLKAVGKWLETHSNWILVFDNVEDPQKIAPFLPASGQGGHILTTSRNPHTKNCLIVDLFSPEESVELLTRLTGQSASAEAEKLAEALGHLSLALTQAGAYMKATQTSFADYLFIFGQERKALWQDEVAPKDYPATVGTTWNISVKKIRKEMPKALELLYLSAYLAPDNIPKFLFSAEGQESLALAKWLHKLQAYSFFTIGQKEESYSVHRLVQASTRDSIEPLKEKALLQTIQTRLNKEWEFHYQDPSTWTKGRLLLDHLAAFASHGKKNQEFLPAIATFFNGLGLWSDFIEINLLLAMDYHNRSLGIRRGIYGEEHPDVADSLNNLGDVYHEQGNLPKAIELHTQSLGIRRGIYGEEHSDVATSLNNLGELYKAQGDLPKAIELHTQGLHIFRKVYGEEHLSVAVSLSNLGGAYQAKGNLPEAIELYNQSVSIRRKVCGEEHPHIALSLNELGVAYDEQGNLPKAIELHTQSLAIRRKVYGEEHPVVATSLNNLGEAYRAQGNLPKAIELHTQSLAIRRKVYGEEHPAVASSLNNLGEAYKAQGNLPMAIELHTQSLAIKRKVYGEVHSDVAVSLYNLGLAYQAQGDFQKTVETYKSLLAVQERLLGKESEEVADALFNLSVAYAEIFKLKECFESRGQELEIIKKLMNDKPVYVAYAIGRLGHVYRLDGHFNEARKLYQEALELIQASSGDACSDFAIYLDLTGRIFLAENKLEDALPLFEKAQAVISKSPDKEGEWMAYILRDLGEVHLRQGEHKIGMTLLTEALELIKKVKKEGDPEIGHVLIRLGMGCRLQKNFTLAIETLECALALFQKRYGERHPYAAETLNHLGATYQDEGDLPKAISFYSKAFSIRKEFLREGHPDITESQNALKQAEKIQSGTSRY